MKASDFAYEVSAWDVPGDSRRSPRLAGFELPSQRCFHNRAPPGRPWRCEATARSSHEAHRCTGRSQRTYPACYQEPPRNVDDSILRHRSLSRRTRQTRTTPGSRPAQAQAAVSVLEAPHEWLIFEPRSIPMTCVHARFICGRGRRREWRGRPSLRDRSR